MLGRREPLAALGAEKPVTLGDDFGNRPGAPGLSRSQGGGRRISGRGLAPPGPPRPTAPRGQKGERRPLTFGAGSPQAPSAPGSFSTHQASEGTSPKLRRCPVGGGPLLGVFRTPVPGRTWVQLASLCRSIELLIPEMFTLLLCPLLEGNLGASAQGWAFQERALGYYSRIFPGRKLTQKVSRLQEAGRRQGAGCQRGVPGCSRRETGLMDPESSTG